MVLPASLAPAQVFLLGPAALWAGNRGELTQGWWHLAATLAIPFLLFSTLFVVLGLAARAPGFNALRALLLGLGVAAWVRGSLLVGDYGVLDGRPIDWSAHPTRPWVDVFVWIGIPLLALLLRRRLAGVVVTAAGALLLAQTIGLLATSPDRSADRRATRHNAAEPPAEIFQFSKDANGLLLILDAFHSDALAEMIEEEDEAAAALRSDLDGFTFFADHTGAFPNTRPSIPALLSGRRYDNEEPLSTFYPTTLEQHSIIPALDHRGWNVDMVSMVGRLIRGPLSHRYRLPRPFASAEDIRFAEAAQLLDLSLFRHAPRALKPWLYNDQAWRVGGLSKLARNVHQSSNGRDFLERFIEQATVARDEPVFKIIHVGIPHLPAVLDATCSWTGVLPGKRENYVEQTRCAMRLTTALLSKLRDLGIYDDMLIVIAADHGTHFMPRGFEGFRPYPAAMPWVVGRAMPLLLVKPPGRRGSFDVSRAPTAITDVAATIAKQLGLPDTFPGTPVFDLDPSMPRSRPYDAYFWEDVGRHDEHFPFVHRFAIDGPVRSASSWKYLGTFHPAGTLLPAGRIDVGRARSVDHLGLGWSEARERDGEHLRWALGEKVTALASLDPGPLRLRARLRVPGFNHPQTILVSIDDRPVATWQPEPDAFVELTADVPAGERPAISTIELRFDRFQTYENDPRPLAAQVSWMELEPDG